MKTGVYMVAWVIGLFVCLKNRLERKRGIYIFYFILFGWHWVLMINRFLENILLQVICLEDEDVLMFMFNSRFRLTYTGYGIN